MSGDNSVKMEDLARAFESDDKKYENAARNASRVDKKRRSSGPKKWALVVLVVGILALVGGGIFALVKLVGQPKKADADYLISAGEWQREDQPMVIWDFVEVGSGKLTTDGHLNNYDFIWSLENGKLKIETSWLYDLNDEFDYTLDQGAKTLLIKNADKNVEVKFVLKERENKDAGGGE